MVEKVLGTGSAWLAAAKYRLKLAGNFRPPRPTGDVILLVTRGIPPHFHGGTFRQVALMRTLASAGYRLEVVTGECPASPTEAGLEAGRRIPGTVRVHRWHPTSRQVSWRLAPRLSGGIGSIQPIMEVASRLEHPPSMILASGPPFAEFLAAALLARRWRVPFILDYRDEWTTSRLGFLERGPGDRRWENQVLATASAVVLTTDAARECYLKTFPLLAGRRVVTIRNGWDELGGSASGDLALTEPLPDTLDIGFFGALGEHWDFPEFVATLAAAFDTDPSLSTRCRVALYGTVSPRNAAAIADRYAGSFALQGLVPQATARAAMGSCLALLLFNPPRLARLLPGKLYEYIACRRPILLYGQGGEMEQLVRGIPGVLVVPRGDPAALGSALRHLLTNEPLDEINRAGGGYLSAFGREGRDREWVSLVREILPATRVMPAGPVPRHPQGLPA